MYCNMNDLSHALFKNKERKTITLYLGSLSGCDYELNRIRQRLAEAGQSYHLHIRISSGGGTLEDMFGLYNACVDNFRERMTTYIDYKAFSAAGLLFLMAPERVIYPHSMVMFHDCRMGVSSGHEDQIINNVKLVNSVYRDFVHEMLGKYFSKRKINDILKSRVDCELGGVSMCRNGMATHVMHCGQKITARAYLEIIKK